MAVTTGSEYDHFNITNGTNTVRHDLKDTKARENLIKVQASEPTEDENKVWISTNTAEIEVPTYDEFSALKSALNNEPFVVSSYVQGARGANAAITTRSDRCTTAGVFTLSAGDKISVINPTQRIAVIAGVANGSFIYDSGWQSGNYTYTVTEQTAGTYFVNFSYSISGENLSPSDLVGVQVSIDRITAISRLVDDVAELKDGVPSAAGVNIIPSVPWERGGIIDGVDSAMNNRVRSDYIDVTDVDHIIYSINANYRIYYCLYKSDKTFISNSEWLTGENTVEFSEDVKYIRFIIGLVNNNDIGCEVTRQLNVTAYYIIEHDVADLYSQYNSLADLDEINLKSWVIGYIYRSGGVDTREQPNYVCTPTMQKFPFDISISVDSGYQFVVLTFDDSGAVTFGTTWLQDAYIIHADTWFGLNLAKTTPEAVTDVSAYTSKIHIRSKAAKNASSPASGLKISVLGDSISTYTGWIETGVNAAHYPKYDVTDVSQMWWHIVADALGSLDGLTVSAISQSAFYDYGNAQYPPMYNTARITRLGNSGAPDMVLIYAGVNDGFTEQNGNISYEYNVTALEALANSTVRGIELTIRKIQVAYPSAKIVIMIPQQVKMSDMPTGYDLERVNKIADEITACADLFGVWKIIDLRKCGINQTNVAGFCGDGNIHPNVLGMRRIADYVLEQLR